jgi:hypothetical protein
MKVKVTKQDIEDGAGRFTDRCGCPIWSALYRALGLSGAFDSPLEIRYFNEARIGKVCFRLPPEAVRFQEQGARGKPVKPFTFETAPEVDPRVRP